MAKIIYNAKLQFYQFNEAYYALSVTFLFHSHPLNGHFFFQLTVKFKLKVFLNKNSRFSLTAFIVKTWH